MLKRCLLIKSYNLRATIVFCEYHSDENRVPVSNNSFVFYVWIPSIPIIGIQPNNKVGFIAFRLK